jgi:hypothetical protein
LEILHGTVSASSRAGRCPAFLRWGGDLIKFADTPLTALPRREHANAFRTAAVVGACEANPSWNDG